MRRIDWATFVIAALAVGILVGILIARKVYP